MELSLFGQKFTSKSGILQLMDDLGKPLPPDVPAYRLGGGNPARIPEIEKIFRREMYRILEDGDNFERTIGCYDSPQGRESFLTAMARLLSLKFGWKIGPENIAVTNGSQSGFFYLFNMFSGSTGKGKKNKILFPLVPEYVGYADQGIEPDTFVTLPAKAERSGNFATPSSIITGCPLFKLPNMEGPSGMPAPRMESVTKAIRSAPLNL